MTVAANAITTVANVQAYPGYNSSWTTAQVESAIDRVSQFIEDYCNCNFINTTYTAEKHDGDGTDDFLVDHVPISSVSALTDTPTGESATTINASTEITVYEQEGRIKLKSNSSSETTFTDDDENISVTYVAGYGAAVTNLPADIVEVATRMVVNWLTSGDSSEISEEKIGDYTVKYGQTMDAAVGDSKSILDLYRRPEIG